MTGPGHRLHPACRISTDVRDSEPCLCDHGVAEHATDSGTAPEAACKSEVFRFLLCGDSTWTARHGREWHVSRVPGGYRTSEKLARTSSRYKATRRPSASHSRCVSFVCGGSCQRSTAGLSTRSTALAFMRTAKRSGCWLCSVDTFQCDFSPKNFGFEFSSCRAGRVVSWTSRRNFSRRRRALAQRD